MPIELHELPPLVREFASYKRTIQGCSAKTVEEYLTDLRTFCRYLVLTHAGRKPDPDLMRETSVAHLELADFAAVKTSEIYEFFLFADTVLGNEACAKSRKLSAIRMFYKYLTVKRNLIENDPSAHIESPKTKRQLPKHLSVEESVGLLTSVQSDTDSRTRARDYAILTLFLNCGMRLSELTGISLRDLDPQLRSLRVLGKGAKERIVYLNDACREALEPYLAVRREMHPKPGHEDALFISGHGQRISQKTVQYIVYKYLDMAGLGHKKLSTHKLRHTAATLMYQSGNVDVRVLKDILGHEQLNTTQIYTHVSDASMQHAVDANPLAGLRLEKKPADKSE